jgi:Zn-dependent protease
MIAMVSNMRFLQFLTSPAGTAVRALGQLSCNLNAMLDRTHRCVILAVLGVILPIQVAAADTSSTPPEALNGQATVSAVKFLAGGAAGLVLHETGHLVFDGLFDARPRLAPVRFGAIPFFAITHRADLSPRREVAVSSAGFWVQAAMSEWLLTAHPDLRHERSPFAKGLLAFNVLTSTGYAAVAIARAGPFERDTRGIADAARIDERIIGLMVLAPAAADAYRYYHPHSRWARWVSRVAKAGSVLVVVK